MEVAEADADAEGGWSVYLTMMVTSYSLVGWYLVEMLERSVDRLLLRVLSLMISV
jgi:hypothetical protein